MVEQGKILGLLAPKLKPQVQVLNIFRAGCEGHCRGVSGLRGLADTQEGRIVPEKPQPSSL